MKRVPITRPGGTDILCDGTQAKGRSKPLTVAGVLYCRPTRALRDIRYRPSVWCYQAAFQVKARDLKGSEWKSG
eukprot:2404441-Rhodomonas_salina.3